MTESASNDTAPPKWFAVVGGLALAWNLIGVMAFAMQLKMTEEAIAILPADQQPLYQNIPIWVTAAYGCAVIGGAIGCIGLLLKKGWARYLLMLSLAGVMVQFSHVFLMTDAIAVLGPTSLIMPAFIIVICIALLLLARHAQAKRWIE